MLSSSSHSFIHQFLVAHLLHARHCAGFEVLFRLRGLGRKEGEWLYQRLAGFWGEGEYLAQKLDLWALFEDCSTFDTFRASALGKLSQ